MYNTSLLKRSGGRKMLQLPKEHTYAVISKVAYLIGVPKRIFENGNEPPQYECFTTLSKDKNARIIRNLCILRTEIEHNFGRLNQAFRYEMKNLYSVPDIIPTECLTELTADGISIYKANARLVDYILEINKHISNRINNCKALFPEWLNWAYIRALFIMPGGTTERGTKAAAGEFFDNRDFLPYQVYMNWPVSPGDGNILFSDQKFVKLLYEKNEDCFSDFDKLVGPKESAEEKFYSFLKSNSRSVMVVDSENADLYKLYSALERLSQGGYLEKIAKIVLFGSQESIRGWQILSNFDSILIESKLYGQDKVVQFTAAICHEIYWNQVDSFVLVLGALNYGGLVSAAPGAHFLSLSGVEAGSNLGKAGIVDCAIDDLCVSDCGEIKTKAVLSEIQHALDELLEININTVFHDACRYAKVEMGENEKQEFFNQHLKAMRLSIEPDGRLRIRITE